MVYSRLKVRVRDAVITLLIVILASTILIMPFYNPSLAVYMTIIAVGMSLALQKYLASFVGHFVIRGSGIFNIGDRIRIGTIKGDVKHIGLFHIILDEVGDDDKMGGELTGKIISVPNLIVLDQAVQNYSRDFSINDEMIACGYIFDEIRIPLKPKSDVQKAVVITGGAAVDGKRGVRQRGDGTFRPGAAELPARYRERPEGHYPLRQRADLD